MDEFPRGTVTFLATDIQGSAEMWERYPDAMPRALERHEHLLPEAVETRGGRVFKNVGDKHRETSQSTRGQLTGSFEWESQ